MRGHSAVETKKTADTPPSSGSPTRVRHDDLPIGQVDPLTNNLFGFRNFVLPELLHRSGHDDERSICDREAQYRFARVVFDAKFSGCSEG